jgi:hypothetical protein
MESNINNICKSKNNQSKLITQLFLLKIQNNVKKKLLIVLYFFYIHNGYAQQTRAEVKAALFADPSIEAKRKLAPNACYIYKTAEDYYNNKPIENSGWKPWQSTNKKVDIVKDGTTVETKTSEMGDVWYSNSQGLLMRFFDKNLYTVVVNGPICYYVQFNYGEVYKDSENNLQFSSSPSSGKYFDFYSETLNGEIIKWSDKMFEKYLKQFGLEEKYNSEKIKREMKDTVMGYETKKLNKMLKYLSLINEKLSKK